jgi:hypothetical protein
MSNKTNNFLIQGVAYTIIDSDARAAISTLAEGLDAKNAIFQYSTMPTAASTNVGQIVQFIGTSTSDYTNGYFYKCVADSVAGTYVWEAIPTQEAANIFQVSTTAELEAIEDGQIVQFVGTTTASYTNGHFYTAITESDVKTISEVQVQTHAQTPRLLATVTTLADLKTQFATAITGFEENHMASLTVTADITLDNNYVLASGTNVLFWYDNSAAQVMGVAISSEGVASIRTTVDADTIVYTINGYSQTSQSSQSNPPSFVDAVFSVGGTNTSVTLTVNNNTGHAIIFPVARGSSASSSNIYPFYIPKGKSISITLTYLGTCTVNGNILYSADTTDTVNVDTWASWVEDKASIYSWQQNVITDAWTGTTRITVPLTGISNTGTTYITGTYYTNPFLARFNNPAGYITAYGSSYESVTFEVCDREGNVQATIPSQSTTWSGTVDTTTSCEPLCQGGCVKVTTTSSDVSGMYLQIGPGTQSGGGPQSRFTIHNCMLTYSWSGTPV